MGSLCVPFGSGCQGNGTEGILVKVCHPQFVHEAQGRAPFYSASTLRPAQWPGPCAVVNTREVRSCLAGNDEVGARRVRTRRNEQKYRGATLANKMSGKAPLTAKVNLLSDPAYKVFRLRDGIPTPCSRR